MDRFKFFLMLGIMSLPCTAILTLAEEGVTLRLYQGATVYVNNPDGAAFEAAVDVRDWNLLENGPRELLIKVYDPDGVALVRKVVEDDGIAGNASMSEAGGWDHEMWYNLLCYSRGSQPMFRWSAFTDPARLTALSKRTFTFPVPAGKKGAYRFLFAGSRDHVVTLRLSPSLKYAVAGHPMWTHGHGGMFKRSYVYVPKGTIDFQIWFAEFDQPVTRRFTVTAPDSTVIWDGMAKGGFQRCPFKMEKPGKYDDQLVTVDVSEGSGDYMMHFVLVRPESPATRGGGGSPALFAPDPETAKALRGGAIYYDGEVFWHGYQVRFHDWLKKNLKPEDYIVRDAKGAEIKVTELGNSWTQGAPDYQGLGERPNFIPLNGVHEVSPLCDRLMHHYPAHKNRNVLNVALRNLATGLETITVGDVPMVTHGNLGYAFGTYGWQYWRPAWRIIQESDAPQEVKDIVKEAIILCGDRLAFAAGIERVNGNAFSHIAMALRYAAEGAKDPQLTQLATVYFDRFASGGWGRGTGISKSGDCQEHFAHDFHYGTYILANFEAVVADLQDPKFKAVRDRILNLYRYLLCEETNAFPWDSRTHETAPIPMDDWKAKPGPDFTVSVNDGNEWFAARRPNYYLLTFHGHLTPEWLNHYFATRLGYGGGIICQLTVPGKGTVIASTLANSYGKGMERTNWQNFHIHSMVGTLKDGTPLVVADSEHLDAKLTGNIVTSSGEVRDRPIRSSRTYTFEADRILCGVKLADTEFRSAFWDMGPSSVITEAYEMIPFVSGADAAKIHVKAAGVDGKDLGELKEEFVETASITIDRGGYGVRIQLDQPRLVKRGKADTILIQLVKTETPPDKVTLNYTLIPYSSKP